MKKTKSLTENLVIGCDWGTSRFRLFLANIDNNNVIAKITTPIGISSINNEFSTNSSNQSAVCRENYYLQYLQKQIEILSIEYGNTLNDISVIVSGMASSSIGIKELEYAQLPFDADGKNIISHWIRPSDSCRNPILMLSGISSGTDVMRGEEVQLAGLLHLIMPDTNKKSIYIFPGTHSKHILVKHNRVQSFRTYMTGELFAILCQHSILKDSISDKGASVMNAGERESFIEGVQLSGKEGLLTTLFTTRTNSLFGRFTKQLNYYFLSGLLIGEELRSIPPVNQLFLSANYTLQSLYNVALKELGLSDISVIVPATIADQAALAGQIQVYKKKFYRE